jgi:hypothetical protein
MSKTIDLLAEAAVTIAQAGAVDYLNRNKLKANPEALKECLKSWINLKLPEALHDAKEAFECGMTQIGVTTFKASMLSAGIEAAKEAGMPALPDYARERLQAKVREIFTAQQ